MLGLGRFCVVIGFELHLVSLARLVGSTTHIYIYVYIYIDYIYIYVCMNCLLFTRVICALI